MPPKKISKFYGKKNISVWLFQKPELLSVWVPEPTLSHHTLIIQGIFEQLVYIFPIQVVARNCAAAPA